MSFLEEKISNEIKWRTDEIATLKFLPFHSNLSDEQKQILKKHTIPALYSLWEGFVKDAFTHYIKEINSLNITFDKIAPELLAHSIDTHYLRNNEYLNEMPKDFQKSIKRITNFVNHFKDDVARNMVVIPATFPTESNINYEVIRKIFIRFNLETLPKEPYEKNLNKLLWYRNSIAHGDFSIPIETQIIDDFSQLVIDLMSEVLLKIDDGYTNKTYLINRID
ncbi:MAG: MAE_28990/MAE_18760 family HEPN-like nuclease [Methylobacter sp.]|nr:MAE_28990/MAE_18760 family HEPN-like nuclease [Methylobacter sp.]MDP2427602.1 MAE_28990/MAE_18760 family HEPN-like nuclease [Methylobacter sp.]MDP3054243.1 MAE_28990/MAE_18760 family HEPN-like nuclease [Methylobacter sp.]MDP3364074.1 MAE_28990/MAE_18760 family HEPN-like nuclease [Methylobacter sp.]MDZ4218379.1 MAE_28990/MAE_18760 family HEPN-like nuclease [Methylobacter sp.]